MWRAAFLLVVSAVLLCPVQSAQNAAGDRSLVAAAARGDTEAVKARLASGADPNEVDDSGVKGWTPLMAAARYGHTAIAEILLRSGANPDTKNEYGATALDVARANSQQAIIQLLLAAGGPGRAVRPAETLKPAQATQSADHGDTAGTWRLTPLITAGSEAPDHLGAFTTFARHPGAEWATAGLFGDAVLLDSGELVFTAWYRPLGKKRDYQGLFSLQNGTVKTILQDAHGHYLYGNGGSLVYVSGVYVSGHDRVQVWDGHVLRNILAKGDKVPLPDVSATVSGVASYPGLSSDGKAIISYQTGGWSIREGAFLYDGAHLEPLPGWGDPLPGLPGVTIGQQREDFAVFPDAVLALVSVKGAPYKKALFRLVAGKTEKILAEGDPDPADSSQTVKFLRTFYAAAPDVFVVVELRLAGKFWRDVLLLYSGGKVKAIEASSLISPGEVELLRMKMNKGFNFSSVVRQVIFLDSSAPRFVAVLSFGTSNWWEINKLLLFDGQVVSSLSQEVPFGFRSVLCCVSKIPNCHFCTTGSKGVPGFCPQITFKAVHSSISYWFLDGSQKEVRLQPLPRFVSDQSNAIDMRHLVGWKDANDAIIRWDGGGGLQNGFYLVQRVVQSK